jgi:hypothetical protein
MVPSMVRTDSTCTPNDAGASRVPENDETAGSEAGGLVQNRGCVR